MQLFTVTVPIAFGRAVRWTARLPIVLRVSRWLPGRFRMRTRSRVQKLARRGAFYDTPIRLDLSQGLQSTASLYRIVVFGAFFSDWNPTLVDVAMWQAIPGVTQVFRLFEASQLVALPATSACTVIIPLGEDHIRQCPRGHRALVPDLRALDILADKARFAGFMEEQELSALCPATYRTPAEAIFPCVLKRTNENSGYGVEIVASRAQLDALLKTSVFFGQQYLLQAYVDGVAEYTFHCVCRDGEILWSHTVACRFGPAPRIGLDLEQLEIVTPSPLTVAQIATVLARLHFSGPCCANYKLRPNGDIALFEINPRFGGSLMVGSDRAVVREALSCIVNNAR